MATPKAVRSPYRQLFDAVDVDDADAAKAALAAGANRDAKAPPELDEDRATALVYACKVGAPRCVAALIEAGADVHKKDKKDVGAIHAAAAKRGAEGLACLDALLRAGASLAAIDGFFRRPEHVAIAAGNAEGLRALLAAGADVESTYGSVEATLLILAAESPDASCVEVLLERGARVDGRDALGLSAAWRAASRGHAECLSALMAAGCALDERGEGRGGVEDVAKGGCAELIAAERARREAAAIGSAIGAARPGPKPRSL